MRLPSLQSLCVRSADVGGDVGAGSVLLSLAPRLRSLSLAGTRLGAQASPVIAALCSLTGLTELDLSGVGMEAAAEGADGAAMGRMLSSLTALRRLDLSEAGGYSVVRAFAGFAGSLSSLTGLRRLAVDELVYYEGSFGALAQAISAMPGLASLSADSREGVRVTGEDAAALGRALAGRALAAGLRELSLGGVLSPANASFLAPPLARALSSLTALRVLSLWVSLDDCFDRPDPGMASAVAAVARALEAAGAPLVKLDLCNAEMGADGAAALAGALQAAAPRRSLQVLMLEGALVGPEGAAALAPALAQLTSLRVLQLGVNAVGDAGATALAPSLPRLARLELLSLNENKIGDAGATALAPAFRRLSMPRLRALDISRNRMSKALQRELLADISRKNRRTFTSHYDPDEDAFAVEHSRY